MYIMKTRKNVTIQNICRECCSEITICCNLRMSFALTKQRKKQKTYKRKQRAGCCDNNNSILFVRLTPHVRL